MIMEIIREWVASEAWKADERELVMELMLLNLHENLNREKTHYGLIEATLLKRKEEDTSPGKILKSKRLLMECELRIFRLEQKIRDIKGKLGKEHLWDKFIWLVGNLVGYNWMYEPISTEGLTVKGKSEEIKTISGMDNNFIDKAILALKFIIVGMVMAFFMTFVLV